MNGYKKYISTVPSPHYLLALNNNQELIIHA